MSQEVGVPPSIFFLNKRNKRMVAYPHLTSEYLHSVPGCSFLLISRPYDGASNTAGFLASQETWIEGQAPAAGLLGEENNEWKHSSVLSLALSNKDLFRNK